MKKTIFYLVAGTFLLGSCAKESFEPANGSGNGRMAVSQNSSITSMNESFQIQGKAASISYAYKAYAGSPVINGTPTEATSIVPMNDHVFVSWHTEGVNYGGAISVYKFNGTSYSFTEVLEFRDTDIHDIEVESTGSVYTIYMAGQRNPDSNAYFISGYKGAVMSKINYNSAASPKFQLPSFMELPLQGYAANGIALEHNYPVGGSVLAITGNGIGNSVDTNGVYRAPKNFSNVSQLQEVEDGLYIERDSYNNMDRFALTERVGSDLHIYSLNTGVALPGASNDATISLPGLIDLERSAIAWNRPDSILIAAGAAGLIAADWGGSGYATFNLGSSVIGVTVDATNNLIYASCAEGGMHVLANPGYLGGGALVNDYDLIGKFQAPTSGPFQSGFYVKDAAIYSNDNISLAVGSGGVFFIEKM